VVSTAPALLALYARSLPQILERMSAAVQAEASGNHAALAALYERLPIVDFSREVLAGQESMLRVLPVPRCGWSDLGTPKRVAQVVSAAPRAPREPWSGVGIAQLSLAAQHSRLLLGHGS
jgi:hypothetical protein